jgi:hypothetical protein
MQSSNQSGFFCCDRRVNQVNKNPEPLRSDINDMATYAI